MTCKYIWVQNEKYYFNKTYTTFELALKEAKKEKKRNKKMRYFITKNKNEMYDLWLNKKIILW